MSPKRASTDAPPPAADHERALRERMEFLELDEADAERLRAIHDELERVRESCIDKFYAHLTRFGPTSALLLNHDVSRLRKTQAAHFSSLTAGRYDGPYCRARRHVGEAHQRIGLAPEWYLGVYRKYVSAMLPALWEACGQSPSELRQAVDSLLKVLFLDIGLALDAYFEADRREIDAAREQAEQVGRIFQATSLSVGTEYLSMLCKELSSMLGVSYAMVSVVEEQHLDFATTVALVRNGRDLSSFRYQLRGSPCESVLHKGVCIYPDGLRALFPQDEPLQQMGLECYAGIPLHGRAGTPIGVLSVFCERPLSDPQRAARLLEVFSLRAETELERLRIEEQMAGSMALFHAAFSQAAVGMLHVSRELTILRANSRAARLFDADAADLIGHPLFKYLACAEQLDALARLQAPDDVLRFEHRCTGADCQERVFRIAVSVVHHAADAHYLQFVIEDISLAHRLQDQLRLQRRVLEQLQSGVVIADAQLPDRPVVYVNPAFCQMTGFAPGEVLGREAGFLLGDRLQAPESVLELRQALREGREIRTSLLSRRKDGSTFWSEVFVAPVLDEHGQTTHLIGILSDISQMRVAQDQLAHHATHDALTQLPNRNLLEDRLRQAIRYAQRRDHLVAVLFIDVDEFKFVNDSWGHEAGDQLLVELSRRLQQLLRAEDTVARYGGDEFVVLLHDMPDTARIRSVCASIMASVSQPFSMGEHELHPSVSIGVALYPQDTPDPAALYRYADMALYRAKDLGRANVHFYSEELNERLQERVRLEAALRSTLRGEGLTVAFQPIVELNNGRPVAVESLARWQHPRLGVVPPDRFIRVAEEAGLITELGRTVLRESCRHLRAWLDAGHAALQMSVNVSARQFREPDLVQQVAEALNDFDVPAPLLCLEITESVMLQDTKSNELTIHRLRDLGVSLAMDDFGTGYSSLSYLRRLPFDKVKIDRSFISELTSNPSDAALARSIISMAHDLGIAVVAEGVETPEQCQFLRRHGCDLIQGYLYSRPLPASELSKLIQSGRRLDFPD